MKNRKVKVMSIVVLIALLSAVILGGINYFSKSSGNKGKEEKKAEFKPEVFAEIDHTWEKEYIRSFHVADEEIMIQSLVDHIEWGEDGDICGFYVESAIWGWNPESKCLETKSVLEEYYTANCIWTEDKIFFLGPEESEKEENKEAELALCAGDVKDGSITNIRKIHLQEKELEWRNCFSVYKNSILFAASLKGEDKSVCYVGTIKGDTVCDIKPLECIGEDEELLRGVFVGDCTQILALMRMPEGEDFNFEIVLIDESGERTKVSHNFLYGDGPAEAFPILYLEQEKDTVYYALTNSEKITIYKASLSGFIEKCKEEAVKQEEGSQKTDYQDGDYSYDAYDTGDFTSELRNKSEEVNKQGVYYEIFVRAFADSDGDGIGDFNGITSKLDYLKELGIEGIWLMPINACESYHGYDVTDYMALNSEYGTEEDFKNLLNEAHKRGIKVIMDFVINHTSMEHPWFVGAMEDENSEYRNYYRWVAENDSKDYNEEDVSNWGGRVWWDMGDSYYYGLFGGHMPDLNYNNPAVREEIKAAARRWLEMGVDGFRLDAAMHIYGENEFKQEKNPGESTLTWWNEFALYCESINPNVYLVGEAWQDDNVLEEYVQPFDTKFNFAFQQHLIEAVSSGTAVTESGENLGTFLQNILDTYDTVDTNYLDGVFGSNHDQERIMSTMQDVKKAKQVAAVYMTLPGNPFIYYGEELGMLGKKPDEMIRTPFLWGDENSYNTSWIEDDQNANTATLEEQMTDETSMYSFYKNIIEVRKAHKALTEGEFKAADWKNDSIMAYTRTSQGETLLVLHNLSGSQQTLGLQGYEVKEVVFSTENDNKNPAGDSIIIGGNESVILLLE